MGDAAENLSELPTPALEAFKPYEHFCKAMLDAFVVVDLSGKVLKCNPLFSQLVGLRTRQILKANSFDEMVTLSVAGKKLNISNLIEVPVPTRIDEVSAEVGGGRNLNLII